MSIHHNVALVSSHSAPSPSWSPHATAERTGVGALLGAGSVVMRHRSEGLSGLFDRVDRVDRYCLDMLAASTTK